MPINKARKVLDALREKGITSITSLMSAWYNNKIKDDEYQEGRKAMEALRTLQT